MQRRSRAAKTVDANYRVPRRRPVRPSAVRTGAAVVEFALTASLLFLLIFTAVEFLRVNTIVNSAENAVYEGAREGIVPGATAEQAREAARAIIAAIGVRGASVTVAPQTLSTSTPEITLTVEIPLEENSFISPRFFLGKTLTKSCTLSREVPPAAANN